MDAINIGYSRDTGESAANEHRKRQNLRNRNPRVSRENRILSRQGDFETERAFLHNDVQKNREGERKKQACVQVGGRKQPHEQELVVDVGRRGQSGQRVYEYGFDERVDDVDRDIADQ